MIDDKPLAIDMLMTIGQWLAHMQHEANDEVLDLMEINEIEQVYELIQELTK